MDAILLLYSWTGADALGKLQKLLNKKKHGSLNQKWQLEVPRVTPVTQETYTFH